MVSGVYGTVTETPLTEYRAGREGTGVATQTFY